MVRKSLPKPLLVNACATAQSVSAVQHLLVFIYGVETFGAGVSTERGLPGTTLVTGCLFIDLLPGQSFVNISPVKLVDSN